MEIIAWKDRQTDKDLKKWENTSIEKPLPWQLIDSCLGEVLTYTSLVCPDDGFDDSLSGQGIHT